MTAPRETGGGGLAQMVWATARGFDLKAPHWDDLGPVMQKAVTDAVAFAALATPRPVEVTEAQPEAFTDEVTGWTTHDSTLSVRYHGASTDLLTLFIEESPLPTNGGPARRTTVKRSALLAALRAQPAGGTPDAQDDAWVVPALKREIDDLRDVLAECFVAVGVAITDDHGLDAGEGERVQGLVRAVMGLDHPKIVAWLALPEDGAPVAGAGGTL